MEMTGSKSVMWGKEEKDSENPLRCLAGIFIFILTWKKNSLKIRLGKKLLGRTSGYFTFQ